LNFALTEGEKPQGRFHFHFQYYICHSPLRAKAAPAMTNGKRKMEYGKYLEIFD
jgi:hypothetical protein